MKKLQHIILIILCFNFLPNTKAQNLVPNSSFEIYSTCPNASGQINNATPWFEPNTLGSSTDYYNQCDTSFWGVPNNWGGGGVAHSGVAYCGIVLFGPLANYREYIEVLLNDTLRTNKKYCISFYVSLSDSCAYAANRIGAYFSSNIISTYGNAISTNSPQVVNSTNNQLINKRDWTRVSGCFIATGGEKYLTIGNFFDNANSDVVYVGDCGFNSGGWCATAYYFIDDISVEADTATGISELQKENMKFTIYPNPNDGNMIFDYSLEKNANGELVVSDITGHVISRYQLENGTTTMSINESELGGGIYFYKVVVNGKVVRSDKLVIIY